MRFRFSSIFSTSTGRKTVGARPVGAVVLARYPVTVEVMGSIPIRVAIFRGVTQFGLEYSPWKRGVVGSSPTSATKFAG